MQVLKEINSSGKPESVPKTIIFVSRKNECDALANDLWNAGYSVDSLHGTHLLTHSPTHSLTYSLTQLLTHSPTYSLTYLLTHQLTYSLTPFRRSPAIPTYKSDGSVQGWQTTSLGCNWCCGKRIGCEGYWRLTHSLTGLLTHSLITGLLTYSLTGLLTHSLAYSLNGLLTYLITHWLTHWLTHSLTHSLTYSLTHSLAYSLTH
jgi:hypothetical protein